EPGSASPPSSEQRQPPSPRGREHHDDAEGDSRSHLTVTGDAAGSLPGSEPSDAFGDSAVEEPWTPSSGLDPWSAGTGSDGSARSSRPAAAASEPGSSPECSDHVRPDSGRAPLGSDSARPDSGHSPLGAGGAPQRSAGDAQQ